MIRHIVFFSSKHPDNLDRIYEGLQLLSEIPSAQHFEIGRNTKLDRISAEGPDFVVYAEFEDEQALAAYKDHPLYKKSISIVRPLRDMRVAADYQI